jgi:hypothetical protein
MAIVVVHEDCPKGHIGFEVDTTPLWCSECTNSAQYRVFFTADERKNLEEHRLTARRAIASEHPRHSFEIFLA